MPIKIGELANQTGTAVETIRYYEKQGLLPMPARSLGNYRLYNETHVARLQFILHCRALDMSLKEVATLLKYWDHPNQNCGDVNDLIDDHIATVDQRIKELALLKQHLIVLREQCTCEASAGSCGILHSLADDGCYE